jgi:hypothetical protein
MLSVLLLVNDSELDDAGGSIDVRCVFHRPGKIKEKKVMVICAAEGQDSEA